MSYFKGGGMKSLQEQVLVTIRGKDTPGITSRLTKVISEGKGVRLLDIEQTVVHEKLLLSILLGFPKGDQSKSSVLKEMLFAAKDLGVNLDFEVFDSSIDNGIDVFQYVITCLSENIGAREISTIATELSKQGINIDKIDRLSHGNIRCIEMLAHSTKSKNPKTMSKRLLPLSSKIGVDIAIQRYGLTRQSKRLVVLDMDSTLIQNEVVDELAKECGKWRKISMMTQRVLSGNGSYDTNLKARIKLLKGVKSDALSKVYKRIKLTPGAKSFIHILNELGYKTAIISSGFSFFTDRLKDKLGFDYAFSNKLEIKKGVLTGRLIGDFVDGKKKAALLAQIARKEGINLSQAIAIGDGVNDLDMLSKAGLGIAFQAKPIVKEKAAYSISRHKGLDSILFLLGIPEREVLKLKRK